MLKDDVERQPIGIQAQRQRRMCGSCEVSLRDRSKRAGFKESSEREENTSRKAESGGEHENPVPRN